MSGHPAQSATEAVACAAGNASQYFQAKRGARRTMTGAGFAAVTNFWPLLVIIAFVGTMNLNSGDASIFVPLEETVLTQTVEARGRTALFVRYSVIGSLSGALGVLAASFPDLAAVWTGWARTTSPATVSASVRRNSLMADRLGKPIRREDAAALVGVAPFDDDTSQHQG
ncbi:MAG TPA: hypothetical protein VGM07_14325 [Stellaceae bacterium]